MVEATLAIVLGIGAAMTAIEFGRALHRVTTLGTNLADNSGPPAEHESEAIALTTQVDHRVAASDA